MTQIENRDLSSLNGSQLVMSHWRDIPRVFEGFVIKISQIQGKLI